MPELDKTPLSDRISDARSAYEMRNPKPSKTPDDSAGSAGALALRYGAEFGASVFVGIMIGLLIDNVFNTKPWGLLIMMGFGLAAGTLGVIRAYKELTKATNPANSSAEPDPGPNE
ncbi:MAG: AtpZ/AtpI family protein [Pseudomonadota bacterium]